MKKPKKANNNKISNEFLKQREKYSIKLGYDKPKWIYFCETMLKFGLNCKLYEARKTVSKYITVYNEKATYKVRFSNHKPIEAREKLNDCDFFVGVTHFKVTTTDEAINSTLKFFNQKL